MEKIYEGIVEGNIIRLEKDLDIPIGTHIIFKLKAIHKDNQQEIKNRQLKLLDKGFEFGRKLYSKREDLYVR